MGLSAKDIPQINKLAYPVKQNSKAHCFVFAFQANQSTWPKNAIKAIRFIIIKVK